MTIAAMEPTQAAAAGSESPDYGQIYTLLSRIMRGQPPPNLSPLEAQVVLDLLTDLEHRLAGHDISNQVNFVTNKYREVMANQDTATESQLPPRRSRRKAANSSSDPGSSSAKPKTPLFSLNPLNVPVQLLNLKKPTPASSTSQS
ncbi:uncharacterized protein LOC144663067 [Oculina patagonica]